RRYRRRAVLRAIAAASALWAGVLALLALLSGCAGLLGSHDVDISESQLTLLLARQFPMERKVLEVVDLSITNPQLTLIPQGNRVGTELDVAAVDRLFGNTANAHIKLDYGLRFQPSDHTIRMTQVRVRELTLASGSSNLHGAAQRIGGLVAEGALENLVIYRMKPAQADEMDRLNLVASPITVTPQGLHMTVSPRTN
ncbi:MAG TPA: hypothetical protein VIN75_01130, partial [Burkholderiaceae bacterium]